MARPALLLLHGALGTSDQFKSIVEGLRDEWLIHTPEFEGHGDAAQRNRPFRIEYFVENLMDYMNKKSLSRVHIFGFSMGGYVGLCLARRMPRRVGKVMTFATKFNWMGDIARAEASRLNYKLILSKAPAFARTLKERHGAERWMNVVEKTREMTLHLGEKMPLTDHDFRQITNSVRISVGDRDPMVTLEESIRVYRLLDSSELQVFPSTSHDIEGELGAKMVREMRDFFDKG